ncbi:penicillin-binding protein activator [Salinimonas chungwhensis]|uniref:penicillin-binding protein activator n=1 Tax=Salinimonas chungwhensis TaxID=265425 RepID=UPI000373106F|nr:penicillin-binding protein activator [Salinimonas chungwhensis]
MQLKSRARLSLTYCALALALISAGCSTSSNQAPRKTIATNESPRIKQVEQTPESLLRQAQQIQQRGDSRQLNDILLDTVIAYLQDDQRIHAQQVLLWLLEQPLSRLQRSRVNTLIAQAYVDDPGIEPEALIDLLQPVEKDEQLSERQLSLLTTLYLRQQDYLAAAAAYVQFMPNTAASVDKVWRWINSVPASEINQASGQYPELQPYFALRALVADNGLQSASLQQALDNFTRVYRGKPLVDHLPEPITQAAMTRYKEIPHITVMLPLSGRYQGTGMAVKDGILAAYYQQLSESGASAVPTISFVDTHQKQPDELINAIGDSRWVIGPLLKETLDMVLPKLPSDINLLALNRPDDTPDTILGTPDSPLVPESFAVAPPSPSATWFALAPEDEAYQLADHIAEKGYRSPIVVAANGSIYQRLLDAFEKRWQSHHKAEDKARALNVVTFDDSGSLKEGITDALGVAQSKSRIDQIRYMVNEKLYNVTRNRRDIDAIVVFASPEQTELLNPMVEASLSPFDGKTVPVYATSRSMEYDSGKNQWRDLQNVRFIDMPWMLPQNRWTSLTDTANQLWPDRSTTFSRFFAFGVDAYQMLPNVMQMALLPQVSLEGLTGTLSVDEKGRVIRRLPQARINNQQVQRVSGE